MTAATPSRIGQTGLAGDAKSLFLKVWANEVMASYANKVTLKDRTRVRRIQSGKSAQFPAIGLIGASYHTPGAVLTGQTVEHGEKVVTIDDLLISDVFLASIDEAMNHYDVRSEYTKNMGIALAQTFDRNIISLAVKSAIAGTSGAVADQGDAARVALGSVTPSVADIITGIYDAGVTMDENNVPEDERFVIVPPQVYSDLSQNDKLVSKDFNMSNGDYSKRLVMEVGGFQVVKSNNFAIDHTSVTRHPDTSDSKYAVDATGYKALCMHPHAIGTVELLGMATEAEYEISRQGWLAVSKMAIGHGVLRPDCIIALDGAVS